MNRRWLGLVILTMVLVAGLVVARTAGPGLVGSALPEPAPGPPTAGDCVGVVDGAPPALLSFNERDLGVRAPTVTTAPCDGERAAEVVLVIEDARESPPAPVGAEDTFDPAIDDCLTAGTAFVGAAGTATDPSPGWTHQLRYLSAFAGPDDRQRAAGQHWLACVVRPAGWNPDEQELPYTGSLRDAVTTGVERDRTGVCALDVVLEDPVTCDDPHRGESFGVTDTEEPSLRAQWLDTCRSWVVSLTGLADPTAAGQLEVTLVVRDDLTGHFAGDAEIPAGAHLRCGIVTTDPGRLLTGSVRALGDQPLPWD